MTNQSKTVCASEIPVMAPAGHAVLYATRLKWLSFPKPLKTSLRINAWFHDVAEALINARAEVAA